MDVSENAERYRLIREKKDAEEIDTRRSDTQMITDFEQMIADNFICDHLVSFNLWQSVL
ncbi:hypothetical protein ACFL2G_01325 [Candidatus Omnitrophota bacterium]